MDNMEIILKKYLEEKYDAELAFLYGSFATSTATKESDIDCICFAPIEKFYHDSTLLNGYKLDGWIYPLEEMNKTSLVMHILPCKVIIDKKGRSETIINEILKQRQETVVEMGVDERKQLVGWIQKMISRSEAESAEANYRYNWLLNDFPELYCKFNNEYYDGPIKTIRRIKETKSIFSKYEAVLRNKNVLTLKALYSELTGENL